MYGGDHAVDGHLEGCGINEVLVEILDVDAPHNGTCCGVLTGLVEERGEIIGTISIYINIGSAAAPPLGAPVGNGKAHGAHVMGFGIGLEVAIDTGNGNVGHGGALTEHYVGIGATGAGITGTPFVVELYADVGAVVLLVPSGTS